MSYEEEDTYLPHDRVQAPKRLLLVAQVQLHICIFCSEKSHFIANIKKIEKQVKVHELKVK
jgi:hypothetical protein